MLITAIDCPVSPADGARDKAEPNHLLGFIAQSPLLAASIPTVPSISPFRGPHSRQGTR